MTQPMYPDQSRSDGFTIIEVLIALVILAVGLLALQSLGVGAVRSVGMAERNTRAAAASISLVEDALQQLRRDELPAQLCDTTAFGDVVSRSVVVNVNNPRLVRVTVRVTPAATGGTPQPLTVTAHSVSPDTTFDASLVTGSACP